MMGPSTTFNVPVKEIRADLSFQPEDSAIQYRVPADEEKRASNAVAPLYPNAVRTGPSSSTFFAVSGFLFLITTATLIVAGVTLQEVRGSSDGHHESEDSHDWGYASQGADWTGDCASGMKQSPIDFSGYSTLTSAAAGKTAVNLASFFDVSGSSAMPSSMRNMAYVHYNGHALQTQKIDAYFEYNGVTYTLLQFHLHTASEHTVNGRQYPGELHMVHQNAAGEYLVVGVMLGNGASSTPAAMASFMTNVPSSKGTEVKHDLDYTALLQEMSITATGASYFTYTGSFTTPPCTEGVTFLILDPAQHIIDMTSSDISKLDGIMKGNYRMVMPVNGRTVSLVTA